jgi:hypothetical protein
METRFDDAGDERGRIPPMDVVANEAAVRGEVLP